MNHSLSLLQDLQNEKYKEGEEELT